MIAKNIIIGESYRHKNSPKYCWAKVVNILKPKRAENTTKRIIVKCRWTVEKEDDSFGLIKYFNPSDLLSNTRP